MDNLVFHPDRPEVLAVLGWKLSTLGDPISDLANNCMAFFLPPHFSALRGTERGKVASDTRREELEFRNRVTPAQRAQLRVWLIAAGKGCGSPAILPALPFLPSIPPRQKHLSKCAEYAHGCPIPSLSRFCHPFGRYFAMSYLCWSVPSLVGTITPFMHMDFCWQSHRRALLHSLQNCLKN